MAFRHSRAHHHAGIVTGYDAQAESCGALNDDNPRGAGDNQQGVKISLDILESLKYIDYEAFCLSSGQ